MRTTALEPADRPRQAARMGQRVTSTRLVRCTDPPPPRPNLLARVWRALLYAEAWLTYVVGAFVRFRWPRRTCYSLPSRTGGVDHSLAAAIKGAPMVFGGDLGELEVCATGVDPWGREPSDVRAINVVRRAVFGEALAVDGWTTRHVEVGWTLRRQTGDFGEDTCPSCP